MLVGPNYIEFDLRTDGFLVAVNRIEKFLGTAGTTTNKATVEWNRFFKVALSK